LKNNGIDPKTYRKWMKINHPDKLLNLPEEEQKKRLVLVKRVTDCRPYLNKIDSFIIFSLKIKDGQKPVHRSTPFVSRQYQTCAILFDRSINRSRL
jgi:hypothetical protein